MSKELECPSCKQEEMVSLECTFQTFPVWLNDDGELDFEGYVIREWVNDAEPPTILCCSCGAEFSRQKIIEYMLLKGEEE